MSYIEPYNRVLVMSDRVWYWVIEYWVTYYWVIYTWVI